MLAPASGHLPSTAAPGAPGLQLCREDLHSEMAERNQGQGREGRGLANGGEATTYPETKGSSQRCALPSQQAPGIPGTFQERLEPRQGWPHSPTTHMRDALEPGSSPPSATVTSLCAQWPGEDLPSFPHQSKQLDQTCQAVTRTGRKYMKCQALRKH